MNHHQVLPRRRRRWPSVGDRLTNPQRRSDAALDAALLEALAPGPMAKWELRDALHEPEPWVYRALRRLKKAGQVKIVGAALTRRKWALKSWVDAHPMVPGYVAPVGARLALSPPKDPPPTSWWTAHAAPDARDSFARAAAERNADASRTSPTWRFARAGAYHYET